MGYFSNGTEGEIFQEQYGARCLHNGDENGEGPLCPVWELHLLYDYDQLKNKDLAHCLGALIPRQGGRNLACRLFVPAASVRQGLVRKG